MFIIQAFFIFILSYLVYRVFPLLALGDYFLVTGGITSNIYLLIPVLTIICAIFLTVVTLMIRRFRAVFIFALTVCSLIFVQNIFLKADGEINNYILLCVIFALIIAPFLSVLLLHIIKKSDIEREIKGAIAARNIKGDKYKFWYQAAVAVFMGIAAMLLIGCMDSALFFNILAPYKYSEDDGHVAYQVYFFVCWVPMVIGYTLIIILIRKLVTSHSVWVIIATWAVSSSAIFCAFILNNAYNINSFLVPGIYIGEVHFLLYPVLAIFFALGALFAHIHTVILKRMKKAEELLPEETLQKSANAKKVNKTFILTMALVAAGYTTFCFIFASHVNAKDFETKGNILTKYNGSTILLKIPQNIGGNTITAIGDRAFAVEGMDEITDYYYPPDYHKPTTMIIVSEGVTTIGENAFVGTDVYTVKLPKSVKSIGAGAFAASNICKIKLPKNVTKIAEETFLNCTYLRAIKLDKNIVSIGKKSFQGSGIVSITIPEGVTVISEDAFGGCPNLQSVNLPKSIKKIAANAFANCPNLRKINLHQQETYIHPSAFVGSNNVIFSQPKSANSVTTKDLSVINGSIVEYTGLAKNLVIPKDIDGVKIFSMAANLFENNSRLLTVDIQADLDYISNKAFKDCVNLREVTLPESILSIEGWAFSGCKSLEKINIPKNIIVINSGTFNGCEELEYIALPEKIGKIGASAFYNCFKLDLKLPNATKVIGENAFTCCRELTTDIPLSIERIDDGAFLGCDYLAEKVTIGKNAKYIGSEAFKNSGVRQMTFLNNTVEISSNAFGIPEPRNIPVFICKKGSTAANCHTEIRKLSYGYHQ